MMIKNILIENFKILKDVTLNNLSNVNIITGKNNVGKSSLLEAIYFYHDRLNPSSALGIHAKRGVDTFSLKANELWGPLFNDFDIDKTIKVHIQKDGYPGATLEAYHNPNYVKQVTTSDSGSTGISANELSSPTHALELKYNDGKGNYQHFNNYADSSGVQQESGDKKPLKGLCRILFPQAALNKEDALLFADSVKKKRKDVIVSTLKSVFDSRINDLVLGSQQGTPTIMVDLGFSEMIPVNYMGNGVCLLLRILTAICNSIHYILIDEIENGFHYSVLPDIWKTIKKLAVQFDCQIFATTHSREAIVAAHSVFSNECKELLSLYRLDDVSGNVQAVHYDCEAIEGALASDLEVR